MFLSKIHLDFLFIDSLHFSLLDCSTDFLLLLMKISEFSNFFHFDFLYGMSGPANICGFWLASFGVNNWLLRIFWKLSLWCNQTKVRIYQYFWLKNLAKVTSGSVLASDAEPTESVVIFSRWLNNMINLVNMFLLSYTLI